MNLADCIARMSANAAAISALLQSVSEEQARWKPSADAWSLLEVINHLYDEEREDFRLRLDMTLHRPAEDWPPIDPNGWVVERGYHQRDLAASLAGFLDERADSLRWLTALDDPRGAIDLDQAHENQRGRMRAGDLLAAWVAHDHLHIRQINELHWQYLSRQLAPYDWGYAGDW